MRKGKIRKKIKGICERLIVDPYEIYDCTEKFYHIKYLKISRNKYLLVLVEPEDPA